MPTVPTTGSGLLRVSVSPLRALAYVGGADSVREDTARLTWLGEAREVTLGRGEAFSARGAAGRLELRVSDEHMSERHARIVRERGMVVLLDEGSTNGSSVNGERARKQILRPGDIVRTGHSFWRFVEFTPVDEARLPGESAVVGPTRTICPALVEQVRLLKRVSKGKLPLLLLGETGTGKEVVARQVHEWSGRKGDFVALHCAAIPAPLVEGELFGHRRGAYTGATDDRAGLVEAATGGTLLLDEVGELPAEMQVKLLRVLQDGEVVRIGETRPRKVDVRLVAATNRNLSQMVRAGRFREDLHARIRGYETRLPPLRERAEDIGILLAHFLRRFAPDEGGAIRVHHGVLERMLTFRWPYNVREMERCVEAMVLLADGGQIRVRHLELALGPDAPLAADQRPAPPDADALRARIEALMMEHQGNVSKVARAMGKSRTQLHRWLKRFGLRSA